MDSFAQFLQDVGDTGHQLDAHKIGAFGRYRDEIRRVNTVFGLISRNDMDRIPSRHFLDSLMPVLKGILPTDGTILDIGSGGGFPGIPLAILLPDTDFVLVESNRRKSTFLRKMRRVLVLNNVTVEHTRAESLLEPEKLYDGAVARAVASIGQLVTWCGPVLKPEGKLICYKGPMPEEETKSARAAMAAQGMVVDGIHRYDADAPRSPTLVVLRKHSLSGSGPAGCAPHEEKQASNRPENHR
ncbi:MAG: 16S rRNA (guanine(527)-N(7))-methyltransferase RsmG [Gemmatimonadetes bacterium]|nr:16S rRNA (guanine(527)-N(7))-methyltransferase RsmG [Gemmatimonadota bacterium]